MVDQTIAYFHERDKIILAISPEGTRKKTQRWRTGFYWVAVGAGVPIVPVAFDFPRKRITVNLAPADLPKESGRFDLPIALGILAFFKYRQLQLRRLFGLFTLSPLQIIGWSFSLILVAFVLTALVNVLSNYALQDKSQPQPLIELFRSLAINRDYRSLAKIFIAAVIIAPISEEIIFRGLFYGVGKRYLHPVISALICSLLFAFFHLSLTAFAGLFVLALLLTLAYERTGSILVPIGMHSLFNFVSLCAVYFQALHNLPSS